MAPRLLNKACIITGTGGSMGRAAALRFASEGAIIVRCDLNTANDTETTEANAAYSSSTSRYGSTAGSTYSTRTRQWCTLSGWKDETWHKSIDAELNLVYFLTRAAWPRLKQSKESIVNLAMEGREAGIRVNSISTGVIESLQTMPYMADSEWSDAMLRKFGQPEEVVALASFLVSSEASFITGAVIKVDGG
ncbi:SDR family NAD(P)-dependent oxidoreductase [Aspergillus undulatus]|uniref:SDR family NAD(P)-dependent oxidoreductase n=1 Tax=Aspergillus undulatus TaxID=1810928 RepID=UPI003CCDBA39